MSKDLTNMFAASESPVFVVPEKHRAAVFEGLEQAERGEYVSDEEMAVLWKNCGLSGYRRRF